MATKIRKYSNIYVSMLRPNSIDAKKVVSRRLVKAMPSRSIVSMMNKELKTTFRSNGRIGSYVIYKAAAKPSPYYYVLNIS